MDEWTQLRLSELPFLESFNKRDNITSISNISNSFGLSPQKKIHEMWAHLATTDWETSFTPGNRRSRAAASSVAAPLVLTPREFPNNEPKINFKMDFRVFFLFLQRL